VTDFAGPPLAYGVAFSLNGKGYVGTGAGAAGIPVQDFWEFDPQGGGSWTLLTGASAFPGPARRGAVAFTIGNRAFVGLGAGESGRALGDLWVFEPGTGWTLLGEALPGRLNAVAFSIGGKGYAGLGITTGNIRLKDFYRYDPENDQWEALEDFPGDARDAALGFALGGKGYLGLGSSIFGALKDDFWAYNPRWERWERVKDFKGSPRRFGLAFSLGNAGWVGLGSNFFQPVEADFWKLPGDEIEVLDIAEEVCPE
jgi:N-acetylneuraminic acid mutarotase